MEVELTRTQRLKIALFGKVYLNERKLEGWSGYLPFYAFKCPKHGIIEDYPHGHYSPFKGGIPVKYKGVTQVLNCPLCDKEFIEYLRSLRKLPTPKEETIIEVPLDSS